ncbi:hypothetical protein BGZ76_003142, partial [Entomortierella beljakovae]
MFSVSPIVPKLVSKATLLVNGFDSEPHFLTFDNKGTALRGLCKHQESQPKREQPIHQLSHSQEELNSLQQQEELDHHRVTSSSPPPSASWNSPDNLSAAGEDLRSHLNESERPQIYPEVLSDGILTQKKQFGFNNRKEMVLEAEKSPSSGKLDTKETEMTTLLNQENELPPQPPLSSSAVVVSESASESKSSSTSSKIIISRKMSLRGARKRLSDFKSNTTPSMTLTQSIKPLKSKIISSALESGSNEGLIPIDDGSLLETNATQFTGCSGSKSPQDRTQIGGETRYSNIQSTTTSPSSKRELALASCQSKRRDKISKLKISREDKCDGERLDNKSYTPKRRARSPQETISRKIGGNAAKRIKSSSVADSNESSVQSCEGKNDQNKARKTNGDVTGYQEERSHFIPKGLVSVTGDESAVKNNNDFCEACLGVGQFICCDTCPKAFHFSCCQPPLDPNELPDEWSCNKCRSSMYPPTPNAPGIFKQLLDNLEQMNPKSFVLPTEIQTFFKGVDTNSDGEYVDTLDYKPSRAIASVEDPLEIRDSHGNIRVCFHCDKTAYGGQAMISCEHCPLHWHLDCLSPPLASRPPSTRKWMCPNHADHIL